MIGRLKLTSPGVLLILAVLAAGGIFLLDLLYLHPYVTAQKDAALGELAARTVGSGRLAMRSEGTELLSSGILWAQSPAIARLVTDEERHKKFSALALREFDGQNVDLAWLTDSTGKLRAVWSEFWLDGGPEALDDLRSSVERALADLSTSETLPSYALLKISGNVVLYARYQIGHRGEPWYNRTNL